MELSATQESSPMARACAVADAILYEGYLLYPYRKSSGKNRVRWQFGVIAPRPWIEAGGPARATVAGSAESWYQHTECLLEAPPTAEVRVRVRFLQLQVKTVEGAEPGGGFTPVDQLRVGDSDVLSFEEAVPRQVDAVATLGEVVEAERRVAVEVPAGEDVEALVDASGRQVGRVVRRRHPLKAALRVSGEVVPAPFRLVRLGVSVENLDEATSPGTARNQALAASLIATHCLIECTGGSFLSLLEPPEWAGTAAKECTNVHTFPVLAGPGGGDDRLVLSSPIILYDHPAVAPESPGDLFDAGEIDEILSLRILTLSDDEKREARATDPRAAAILDRVGDMPPDVLRGLHGTLRDAKASDLEASDLEASDLEASDLEASDLEASDLEASDLEASDADRSEAPPWWEAAADATVSPTTDSIVVAGTPVTRGSRVRLHPRRRGTDAHDMFLAGRAATVDAVLLDVDGSNHVAVTLDDDPGAELHQWYGRFRYFSPEEIEPLPEEIQPMEV